MQKIPHDLAKPARAARRQGWEIVPGGSGHLRWHSPSGLVITTSHSPSNSGAVKAALKDLQKAGLTL